MFIIKGEFLPNATAKTIWNRFKWYHKHKGSSNFFFERCAISPQSAVCNLLTYKFKKQPHGFVFCKCNTCLAGFGKWCMKYNC